MAATHPAMIHVLTGSCFFMLGCASGQGDLAGSVSYNGKKVQTGSVLVLAGDGITRSSLINEEGGYLIRDIPAGRIKIAVNSPVPSDSPPPAQRKHFPKKVSSAKPEPLDWFPIPEKYGSFDQSGLTYALKPGTNTWDIDLK